MQRNPRLSGLSGSPRTPTSLPSSTSASIPQSVGWQFIGHIVRTVRNDAMPAKDTGYRTQRSPAGEARRQSAHPIPSAGAEELEQGHRQVDDGEADEQGLGCRMQRQGGNAL